MVKYSFSLFLFIAIINLNFIKTLNNSKTQSINLEFISQDNQNQERKNLIIGAFSNYNWNKVKIFFKSYQNAGFKNCDCVMFVIDVPKSTIDGMKSCGVIVYPIPEQYKKELIINARWKIYADFLSKNQDKYEHVFTADIRDVLFQRDLFQLYDKKPYLGIAIEDGILTEGFNRNWLIEAYGEESYKKIMNERIFCVGSVWGTTDKFMKFANEMWTRIKSIPSNTWGIEQAVGNFLIYHDKIFDDCLIKSNNTDGYVMTIGLTNPKNIVINLNYEIFNGKGEIAAVVHQYDRHENLNKFIESKYDPESLSFQLKFIFIMIILDIIIVIIIFCLLKRKFKKNSIEIDSKIEMMKMPKKGIDLDDEEINSDTKLINQ